MTAASEIEALRGEMTAGFATLSGKLDGYVLAHASQHSAEQQAFFQHKLELAPVLHDLTGPPSIESRTRALEDGQLAQATVIKTLKAMLVIVTGGSILSVLVGMVTLWRLLTP